MAADRIMRMTHEDFQKLEMTWCGMEGGTGRLKMLSAPQQTGGETELEAEIPAAMPSALVLISLLIQTQQLTSKTDRLHLQ